MWMKTTPVRSSNHIFITLQRQWFINYLNYFNKITCHTNHKTHSSHSISFLSPSNAHTLWGREQTRTKKGRVAAMNLTNAWVTSTTTTQLRFNRDWCCSIIYGIALDTDRTDVSIYLPALTAAAASFPLCRHLHFRFPVNLLFDASLNSMCVHFDAHKITSIDGGHALTWPELMVAKGRGDRSVYGVNIDLRKQQISSVKSSGSALKTNNQPSGGKTLDHQREWMKLDARSWVMLVATCTLLYFHHYIWSIK